MPIRRGSMRSPIFCARSRWKRRPTFQRAVSTGCGNFFRAGKFADRLRKLGLEGERDVLEIFTVVRRRLSRSLVRERADQGGLGFDAVVGNYASPYAPGSAYVLLHHCFGEVNGAKGQWGHAIGGMGAISEAMANAARARGVDIRIASPVREVLIEKGRAVGVVTQSGRNLPRQENHRQRQSEIALSRSRPAGGAAGGFSRTDRCAGAAAPARSA